MVIKFLFKEVPLPKPTMRWAMLLSGIGLLATGANIFYAVKIRHTSPSSSVALAESSQTKVTAVTALGQLEPKGKTISLAPPPNLGGAKVVELRVKEGEPVEANQIVAVLENEASLKAAVEQARQEVKVAQANLAIIKAGAKPGEIQAQKATIRRLEAQLQGEILTNQATLNRLNAERLGEQTSQQATLSRLQAELKNAEIEYQRYQQLSQEGAISTSELDRHRLTQETAQKRVQEAQATFQQTMATLEQEIREAQANLIKTQQTLSQQIQEAKATLEKISEVRDVDIQKAKAEIERAQASLARAQQDLELTYVKSPITGRILKIHSYPGETILAEKGIVELGKTQQMMVTAEVYESDISQVNLGQSAIIKSENGSFSGEIKGKVTEIGWLINRQGVFDTDPASDVDNRVVDVKIELEYQDSLRVSKLTYSQVLVKILL